MTWVLHPGGEAQYYLRLIQVYNINTAQLREPGSCTAKGTEKGQKDNMGIDDIGIFEFIFHGLPEPPELEGVDEDRL